MLIICIMGAAIALVLADRRDAVFILISVFIIFCTTATLCLVFVPKVRLVVLEIFLLGFSYCLECNRMSLLLDSSIAGVSVIDFSYAFGLFDFSWLK